MVIETSQAKAVIDITQKIQDHLKIASGLCALSILHTAAALTTADLDPGTDQDLLDFLAGIVPQLKWRHPHDPAHAPAHLLASLIGSSVTVTVKDGKLQLGQWQRVVLVELDGPRVRQVSITQIST